MTAEELDEAMRLGELAYTTYRDYAGGVSLVSGAPLPFFRELPPAIQRAWAAAANVVAIHQTGMLLQRVRRI